MLDSKWKVTDWTYWGDLVYGDLGFLSPQEWEEVRECVIKEIKDKGYKFCGFYHQNKYITPCEGVPVINDKYRFETSCRGWGKIMAEAYGHFEKTDYCDWAWVAREPEVYPVPSLGE